MTRFKSRDEFGFQILVNGFLLAVLLMVIIPLWRVIMMSVTPIGNLDNGSFGMWIAPNQWSFEAFQQLLTHPNFLRSLGNSVFIMVVGTTVNLLFTIPLAYALSIPTLPGRRLLIGFILFTFLFNPGLVPVYLVVTKLGLRDSFAAVILPTAVSVYNTLVMKSFFEGLPEDLKEAARIDGASELQVLAKVILPLSRPIILTIGMFYAVAHWNEFFAPILYLDNAKLMPLPVLLRNILMSAGVNEYLEYDAFSSAPIEAIKAAGVLLTMLPMVFLYPWIQRYFTKG
ncbi:MAG TPA: carbohydrate ABC transporter permease, partial [Anaerolineae bacterium]|nr:carbohydrate ABC transporter permease [Anaerolineae bacterium]